MATAANSKPSKLHTPKSGEVERMIDQFEGMAHAFALVNPRHPTPEELSSADADEAKRASVARDIDSYMLRIGPSMVLLALAVEIAMKALIARERGQYEATHSLQRLADKLSAPARQTLIETTGAPSWQELHQALASSSNAFENWRYVYEADFGVADTSLLSKMVVGLRKLLSGKDEPPDLGSLYSIESSGPLPPGLSLPFTPAPWSLR